MKRETYERWERLFQQALSGLAIKVADIAALHELPSIQEKVTRDRRTAYRRAAIREAVLIADDATGECSRVARALAAIDEIGEALRPKGLAPAEIVFRISSIMVRHGFDWLGGDGASTQERIPDMVEDARRVLDAMRSGPVCDLSPERSEQIVADAYKWGRGHERRRVGRVHRLR